MDICTAGLPPPHPPVLRQPRQGPFAAPPGDTQPTAVAWPPFGPHRRHAPRAPLLAGRLRLSRPIALHPLRPAPRTSGRAVDGGARLQQRHPRGDLLTVDARHQSRPGHPLASGQERRRPAPGASIRRGGAGFFPPPPARPRRLSTTARDQSIFSAARRWASQPPWRGDPTPPAPAANRAGAASMACRRHRSSPAAALPPGAQPAAQRACPSPPPGRGPVAARLGVWPAGAVRREHCAPTSRRVQEVLPCTHDTPKGGFVRTS
jgi:hypothetical protein